MNLKKVVIFLKKRTLHISLSEKTLTILEQEASKLDIPVTTYVKIKLNEITNRLEEGDKHA